MYVFSFPSLSCPKAERDHGNVEFNRDMSRVIATDTVLSYSPQAPCIAASLEIECMQLNLRIAVELVPARWIARSL